MKIRLQWPLYKDYPCYECGRQWHLQWPLHRYRPAPINTTPATLWSKSLLENLAASRHNSLAAYEGELRQGATVKIIKGSTYTEASEQEPWY